MITLKRLAPDILNIVVGVVSAADIRHKEDAIIEQ